MAHRCPSWCHKCPDLIAIVAERDGIPPEAVTDPVDYTMPGCMGGAMQTSCCCFAFENAKDRRPVATRAQKLAVLKDLVRQYPQQARQIVADLAPPKETDEPRLKAV